VVVCALVNGAVIIKIKKEYRRHVALIAILLERVIGFTSVEV
jgi:hypothetical protein